MTTLDDVVRRQTILDKDRFDLEGAAATMMAVVTTGNGGLDKLDYREVPVPKPAPGEVLLQVLAAGVNNTEINTRLGWYSKTVTDSTESTAEAEEREARHKADGGWSAPTPFPFIQGTDCCGRVVAVAAGGDAATIGTRVLVRACMRPLGFASMENTWMASDFDGAFAQFVKVPASEIFAVECAWSDIELATIPCSYGAAENMVHRAGVAKGEHVLVTGASGGVGSAAVQLAKRRGAIVTADDSYRFGQLHPETSPADRSLREEWLRQLRSIGADRVVETGDDIAAAVGEKSMDVVIDNVAGPAFDGLLRALKRGGRYASSGAIAGPLVTLDKRTFYLQDLTLIGCTAWDAPVFPNLVAYIERGEIQPLVAKTFPLGQIADAQRELPGKKQLGNFVLIPPAVDG